MVDCRECDRAELRAAGRVLGPLLVAVYDWQERRNRSPLAGIGETFRAMLGGAEPSPYERHRDEYARTGDGRELARMLRHVR